MNPEDRLLSKAELVARSTSARGIVTLLTDVIDKEVLESLPELSIVANVAVGFNNVDVAAATRLGILVTNTPGVLTETTADFAWALLMAAARRVVEADVFTRAGKFKTWGLQMFLGHEVYGKTLGIIGYGRIGQAMARRAEGFSMKVQYCTSGPGNVSLETLLATSDFISLHVPLNDRTRHLLNDEAFAKMKPNCIVINTARGPVIDEKALVRALKDSKIAGAGLDVFEREPEIEADLLKLNNVVLAPHIASASRETRLRMCMMAAENLLAAFRGERPPNLVNPEVWESRRQI
jgi:lactate dehydrogenase-like 2-hydroxyacid dehydrogenase